MRKVFRIFVLLLLVIMVGLSFREASHSNKGRSSNTGTPASGSLSNAYLFPFSGENYSYFSLLSYYILDNAYLHSALYKASLQAYKTCEETCPNIHFGVMECSNPDGGEMFIHRTHRNGMSIDFMTPLKKGDKQYRWEDRTGVFHYLLEYDETGKSKLNKQVEIDFESMAKHLLALDDACREQGIKITKVIFKVNLKDDLFATPSGRILQKRGIYFVKYLSKIVDDVHDDHYHIDFEFL